MSSYTHYSASVTSCYFTTYRLLRSVQMFGYELNSSSSRRVSSSEATRSRNMTKLRGWGQVKRIGSSREDGVEKMGSSQEDRVQSRGWGPVERMGSSREDGVQSRGWGPVKRMESTSDRWRSPTSRRRINNNSSSTTTTTTNTTTQHQYHQHHRRHHHYEQQQHYHHHHHQYHQTAPVSPTLPPPPPPPPRGATAPPPIPPSSTSITTTLTSTTATTTLTSNSPRMLFADQRSDVAGAVNSQYSVNLSTVTAAARNCAENATLAPHMSSPNTRGIHHHRRGTLLLSVLTLYGRSSFRPQRNNMQIRLI
ncbi:hypothetical protein FHG87_006789 [Trinorchestia longiramus]|nr:hypothetical protein FHG87_006789 [Trinorchestia longiramus]